MIPDPRTLTPPQTIDDTYVKANNTKGDGVISVSTSDYIDGEDIFELYTNKLELKLPRGLYDAENIAELINSKAVSLDYGGVNTSKSYAVTENPLLRTIQQVKIDDNKEGWNINIESDLHIDLHKPEILYFYREGHIYYSKKNSFLNIGIINKHNKYLLKSRYDSYPF